MERILLVEDDDMLSSGLVFALEKEGFSVKRARTMREGMELYAMQAFDLLLLDVMLPDGSGFEICRTVREESNVPVMFLTACDEEVNVVQGLDLGGDDYISKPFRVKELVSRIKANLRRAVNVRENTPETAWESGGIAVKLSETKVTRYGAPVELTPVEYKLLVLFMRHEGMTLTREQLLSKLWDAQGEFVDDNTLSVNIRRLREKLEDDPAHPARIITVRGVGYRWERRGGGHA